MKSLRGVMSLIVMFLLLSINLVSAQSNQDTLELIPKTTDQRRADDADTLWTIEPWEDFREQYNAFWLNYAARKNTDWLWRMLASWIVTWDTILMLLTRVIKFIANAALIFGSAMFIYAWYLYITSVFTWDAATWKANEAIKDAVLWIVIVIFSFAIQKIVIEAFLDTYVYLSFGLV